MRVRIAPLQMWIRCMWKYTLWWRCAASTNAPSEAEGAAIYVICLHLAIHRNEGAGDRRHAGTMLTSRPVRLEVRASQISPFHPSATENGLRGQTRERRGGREAHAPGAYDEPFVQYLGAQAAALESYV
jgi:hypothetical protein